MSAHGCCGGYNDEHTPGCPRTRLQEAQAEIERLRAETKDDIAQLAAMCNEVVKLRARIQELEAECKHLMETADICAREKAAALERQEELEADKARLVEEVTVAIRRSAAMREILTTFRHKLHLENPEDYAIVDIEKALSPGAGQALLERVKRLQDITDWARAWLEDSETECRADEDCHHCLGVQLLADLDALEAGK